MRIRLCNLHPILRVSRTLETPDLMSEIRQTQEDSESDSEDDLDASHLHPIKMLSGGVPK